jgi:hypothetical protein
MVIIVIVDFNRQFFSSLQFFVFQFIIGIRFADSANGGESSSSSYAVLNLVGFL